MDNLILLDSSDESDLEDAMLLEGFENNIEYRAELYGEFNLEILSDQECKANFCFEKKDIPRLVEALRIPNEFNTDKINNQNINKIE